jgi:hypothetical protein
MTPEERELKSFTRRNLQRLPNWPDWDAAFDAQLDAHLAAGALGLPVPRPVDTSDGPPNTLCIQWSNVVKPNGKRKCRACIDGSKRAAPWLRQFAQTYVSCIEQPCMHLFFALAAVYSLIVSFGDTTNAFQQSPTPTRKCHLRINDAYASCWYCFKRYGIHMDWHANVIPVERALQGHPEAGRLWETMIVDILSTKMNFSSTTTHERNLYHGTIDGTTLVLVCRQIDDYAIASSTSPEIFSRLIAFINSHATTKHHGVSTPSPSGLTNHYNRLDVHQTRDHIKLSCEVYLRRILQTHGWEAPGTRESDRHDSVPLSADVMNNIASLTSPDEPSPDHKLLEKKAAGFSYRQVLGELTYAYVICRLDIGFAVTFLARFALAPHKEHYTALKNVLCRTTIVWGLVYGRRSPLSSLPFVALDQPALDPSTLPPYLVCPLDQLVGFIDASYAVDPKTRRSITCIVFCFGGAAIAYKSKLQVTVATSSAESEFYAAVHATKIAKYLRSVLDELGFPCSGPTPLYEDNQAAIAMVNECRPTPGVCHLDIQYFANQERHARGLIQMFHIPGVINNADQQTKALSFVLHSRHARRSMGHYGPP